MMAAGVLPPLLAVTLAGSLGLLGYGFAEHFDRPVDISPIGSQAGSSGLTTQVPQRLPEWDGPDPKKLTAIVEAPLFVEGRRMPDDVNTPPAPEPVVESAPAAMAPEPVPPPDYRLVGVMLTGSERKALVAPGSASEERWVTTSEVLGGWTVEAVASDHILLSHDSEMTRIDLHARGPVATQPDE